MEIEKDILAQGLFTGGSRLVPLLGVSEGVRGREVRT